MSIAFPESPTVDQTYTYGVHEWIWNGEGWRLNVNNGQVDTSFQEVTDVVINSTNEMDNSDLPASAWLHKVYV